jgi:hypothetical protein
MQSRGIIRPRLRRIAVVASTLSMLLVASTSIALAAPDDGLTPKSMFLDLGGVTPEEIAARVDRICAEHRDPASDSYIMNVVLVGLVDTQGDLRVDQLLAVLPHVPGGGITTCFDNVFIGPTQLDPTGQPWKSSADFPGGLEPWCADSLYCGGIMTPSWRWANIEANREAADQFLAFADLHFPGIRKNLNWYITYEGYFDWLGGNMYSSRITSAYTAYMLEMVRVYNEALQYAGEPPESSSRAVLWSPAYANAYYSHSQLQLNNIRDNMRTVFHNVQTMAVGEGIARGVDWLDMQDKLGQTDCYSVDCYTEVKRWYQFLTTVNFDQFSFASLRVNMELFSTNIPGPDLNEHMARQNFYEANGIPIGASWELRFWNGPTL